MKYVQPRLTMTAMLVAMNIAGGGYAAAQTATAPLATYQSGVERVVASDQLRMLSQQISASACLVDAGVSADTNKEIISNGLSEFDRILTALRDGDAEQGIATAEENRKMLAAIRGLSLQWDRLKIAAEDRVAGRTSDELVDYLSRQNINTMHAAKYLVIEAVNTYAIPPALLQTDAFTINILVRQRTLSHQISKELCGIASGNETMGNQARLRNAIRLFDASLLALRDGFPAAGVSAPQSEASRDTLSSMTVSWAELKAEIEQAATQTDIVLVATLVGRLTDMQVSLDDLVTIYTQESKNGL